MNASGPGSNVRAYLYPHANALTSFSVSACSHAACSYSSALYHLHASALHHPCRRAQSTMQVIRQSLRTEGAMFMFKGWLPAWTRLQPTTILIFLTLEQLKNAVDVVRGTEGA